MQHQARQPAVRSGLLRPPALCPAKSFVPMALDDDMLRAHGLPPRPAEGASPRRHALWKRLMSKRLSFVAPEFTVVEKDDTPPPVDAQMHGTTSSATRSRTWSGAVHTVDDDDSDDDDSDDDDNDCFTHIEASWTIPMVFPTPDKWDSETAAWSAEPSEYTCGIWVGIDGWKKSHDILQAGTGMHCTVQDNGSLEHSFFAWFEWYPVNVHRLTNFRVHPGDVITVLVDFTDPAPDDASSNYSGSGGDGGQSDAFSGQAVYVNETNATYTSFQYTYHCEKDDYRFKGNTAEWILERHRKAAMPNFGASFIYNCCAVTDGGDERDLSGSTLISMIEDTDDDDSQKLSTPVQVSSDVLGLYWGDGTILARHVKADSSDGES